MSLLKSSLTFLALGLASQTTALSLKYVNTVKFVTGTKFQETELGGLSGLMYNKSNNEFVAISDDRATNAPARIYHFAVKSEGGKFSVAPTKMTILKNQGGKDFKQGEVDFESFIILKNGNYLASSEGDIKGNLMPSFFEFKPTGEFVAKYELAKHFQPVFRGMTQTKGVFNNAVMEAMAIAPDSSFILYAPEDALVQDLTTPPGDIHSVRLVRVADEKHLGAPQHEYLYPLSKTEGPDNGITEFVVLDDRHFLSLERAYLPPPINKNVIKIYSNELPANVTDVKGQASLSKLKAVAVKKDLAIDMETLVANKTMPRLDNFEGMSWGPEVNGKKILVIVSDNNFNPTQETLFVFFEVQ
jgi:hypothetical protein